MCGLVCEKILSIGRPYCWTKPSGAVVEFVQLEECDLFPLESHQYEGRSFPVPRRAEKLLEIYYGDWRALPPEGERNPYAKMKLILPTEAPRMWWAVR